MSNRGEFVGTAPDSGNYIPSPVPAEQEDLPVYVNDELLRLGGTVNGMLEGGTLPPHSSLPKRYREGMIMNFSGAVGDGVDSSGVWLYKNAKWWKLIDDPSVITGPINDRIDDIDKEIDDIDKEIDDLNSDLDYLNNVALPELQQDLDYLNNTALPELQEDLDNLNNVTLPAVKEDLDNLTNTVLPEVKAELDDLNNTQIPELTDDLTQLEGKFPITEVDISDDAISAPKLQANSVIASKIIAGAISTEKLASLSVTTNKLVANAVTVDKLAANSVNAEKIVGKTITGDKIAANTIEGDKIIANSVNGNRIITNTLHGDKIIANSINGNRIIANTIYGDKLVANTVNGNKINSATKVTAGSGKNSATLDGASIKWRIYAGSSNPDTAPFKVDKDGNLFAEKGHFTGNIAGSGINGIRFKIGTFKTTEDGDLLVNVDSNEGQIYDPATGTITNVGKTDPFTTFIGVSVSHMGDTKGSYDKNFNNITGPNEFRFNRDNGYDGTEYFSYLAFGL